MKREDTKTKVIEGWVDQFVSQEGFDSNDGETIYFTKEPSLSQDQRGTLVIGERGFAESEVKAMLKELEIAQTDPSQYIKRIQGWSLDGWKAVARQKVLMKYGIDA